MSTTFAGRRAYRAILAPFALSACVSGGQQPPAQSTEHPLHPHPTTRAMTHAFERVNDDALRCMRPGDNVAVTGEFEGSTGAFQASRIAGASGELPYAVSTCLRVATERAHVRPFTEESEPFSYTFSTPPDVQAASSTPAPPPTTATTPAVSTTVEQPIVPPSGTIEIGSRPAPADLVRREGDALQRCYEQAAERDHRASGSIELHFTLDSGGRITHMTSHVEAPPHDDITLMELVAHCIEAHVRLIQFGPQPSNSNEVVIPMTFHPGGIPID